MTHIKIFCTREKTVPEPNCFSLTTKNNHISSQSDSMMDFSPNAKAAVGKSC